MPRTARPAKRGMFAAVGSASFASQVFPACPPILVALVRRFARRRSAAWRLASRLRTEHRAARTRYAATVAAAHAPQEKPASRRILARWELSLARLASRLVYPPEIVRTAR